jgi:hypothetical protein
VFIEIIPGGGVGRGAPLRIPVTQVVVYQDNGTPIACAAEYGTENSQAVSMAGLPDFNRTLRALGVGMTVICDGIAMPPPPPGARLVADPNQTR